MTRFKVEKRPVEVHEVVHRRVPVEFPIAELKKTQHFKVPLHLASLVRVRIQSVKREKPNRQYVTRTTPDGQHLRVWRTA